MNDNQRENQRVIANGGGSEQARCCRRDCKVCNSKRENEDVIIDKELKRAIGCVLDVAQSHLEASKDLPERMSLSKGDGEYVCPDCGQLYYSKERGHNSCLEEVTPIVARLREENENLKIRLTLNPNNLMFNQEIIKLKKEAIQLQSSLTASEQRVKELEKLCQDWGKNQIFHYCKDGKVRPRPRERIE